MTIETNRQLIQEVLQKADVRGLKKEVTEILSDLVLSGLSLEDAIEGVEKEFDL